MILSLRRRLPAFAVIRSEHAHNAVASHVPLRFAKRAKPFSIKTNQISKRGMVFAVPDFFDGDEPGRGGRIGLRHERRGNTDQQSDCRRA